MDESQKPEFFRLLAGVLASYAKPLPEKAILAAWWANLQFFPLQTVAVAFRAYADENGEFAPVPNGIAKRCRLMDGRPGAEEAFALALTTLDEQITVVWTQECAEAFFAAKPVLESAGSISARKTFIEVYERLVSAYRAQGLPVFWFPSPGLDKIGYAAAIKRATVAGLLPAPAAVQLLEAPKAEAFSLDPRQQLDYIRTMVLDGIAEKQRRADAEIDARIEAEDEIGAEIQRKVEAYVGDQP
jgi:hypothetical protein